MSKPGSKWTSKHWAANRKRWRSPERSAAALAARRARRQATADHSNDLTEATMLEALVELRKQHKRPLWIRPKTIKIR
jgi:hypothetical protein